MQITGRFLPCTVGCFFALSVAHADTQPVYDFSGNMMLTTDYLFRGVSQTDEGPAIQGGFDYSHTPSGFYLGAWASSIEFNTANNTNDSSIEVDLYGGIAGEFSSGISWDIGGIYYYYPDQNEDTINGDYNYWEVYGELGYMFSGSTLKPAIGTKFSYSNDYFGEDGSSLYSEGSLDLSLPNDFGLGFHLGLMDVDGGKTTPRGYDYMHASTTLSKEVAGFDLDLSYNRAFDKGDCPGNKDFCEAVVLSVSRNF
uniref:Lipoprotein n=1 Tax=Candidatus Kentrum sp. TUN TaxID=2126343 RepID=A0A450ZVH5_9GAMM|nr:MAG: conserved hypothetical protein [Candidatus Kentron sp. TUN]VFK60969.1 MAG: conserved hypothetical protein [Candidatus Kentron sp. TUN]VFK66362.1 MAG: conserved hypothetical protein [Candidatus Kentron sp. TUN]